MTSTQRASAEVIGWRGPTSSTLAVASRWLHELPTQELEGPGLDGTDEVATGERDPCRGDGELDDGGSSRLERHARIPEQLCHRRRDRGDRVMPVQLDHIGAGAHPRVRNADADLDPPVGRYRRGGHPQVVVDEGRVGQAEAERANGFRVEVGHGGPAPEDRVQVGVRLRTPGAREADGETAGGVHPPADDAGDRRGALFAGKERLNNRCTPLERPIHHVRASGHEHENDGRAGGEDRLRELALHPGQLQRVGVASLTGGAASEQACPVAGHDDRDVGLAGGGHGGSEPGAIRVVDVAPLGVDDVARGELRRDRLEDAGHLDAERHIPVVVGHVVRERVAAEERVGAVGVGADHRDLAWRPPAGGSRRSRAG